MNGVRAWLLALAFGALFGCGSGGPIAEPGDGLPRVRAAKIEAATDRPKSRHLVLLEPARRARLAPRYGGEVSEVLVDEQVAVQEGQLLIRLRDADVRASLRSARGAVSSARERLDDNVRETSRSAELRAAGVESARQLEAFESATITANAALEQARGQFLSAKDRRDASKIGAPFDGIITAVDTEVGEYAAPGQSVLTISELSTLAVEVPLSEQEAVLHDQGGLLFAVVVRDHEVGVELEWVAREADAGTATFPARLRIANPDGKLRAGESAEVFVSGPALESRPTIPATAVRWDGAEAYVLTISDGVVHRAIIEVLENVGEGVAIESELEIGTSVVARGPSTLADGDKVVVAGSDAGPVAQR